MTAARLTPDMLRDVALWESRIGLIAPAVPYSLSRLASCALAASSVTAELLFLADMLDMSAQVSRAIELPNVCEATDSKRALAELVRTAALARSPYLPKPGAPAERQA